MIINEKKWGFERPLEIPIKNSRNTKKSLLSETYYKYDNGNLIETLEFGSKKYEGKTVYEYNSNNNLILQEKYSKSENFGEISYVLIDRIEYDYEYYELPSIVPEVVKKEKK